MSIFSNFKDEAAPALISIEEDAAKAIEAGRQWIAGMLARLNDFKTALEKDIEDAEAAIKQAATDAESTIAGKKAALAKVNAELETYAPLAPAPAPAASTAASTAAAASTAEPVTSEPPTTAEPALTEAHAADPAAAEPAPAAAETAEPAQPAA